MEVQHRPNSYEYSDSLNLGGGEPYRPASFLQPNAEPQGVVAGGSSEVSNAVPPQNEQDAIEDYSYSYESVEYDSEPSQSDNSMSLDEEVAPANIEEGSDQDTEELVVMENNSLENQASEEEISAIQMAEANNSDESRRSRPEHRASCEFCGFTTCRKEILGNNEKADHHERELGERARRQETKYSCEHCDYGSNSIVEIEDHSHTHVAQFVSNDQNIPGLYLHNLIGFYTCTSCPHNIIQEDKENKINNTKVSSA